MLIFLNGCDERQPAKFPSYLNIVVLKNIFFIFSSYLNTLWLKSFLMEVKDETNFLSLLHIISPIFWS